MAIYNLGSINADNFYSVPHIPVAGETLAADRLTRGLGGKGTNMSVAAARAAARVFHIGAVGQDGRWAQTRLLEYGVDVTHIAISNLATGHANICVAPDGENQIVLFAGANHTISKDQIGTALSGADNGDFLVLQNETNAQTHAAEMGARLGLRVAYAAAPFDTAAVQAVLPYIEFLFLNTVEAAQLEAALGMAPDKLPVRHVIVTLGADGCRWIDTVKGKTRHFPAFPVTPVDTTGAGDTFTGYVVAGVDRGQPIAQAIQTAIVAAAIMVTRRGTADVIPDLKDVQEAKGAS